MAGLCKECLRSGLTECAWLAPIAPQRAGIAALRAAYRSSASDQGRLDQQEWMLVQPLQSGAPLDCPNGTISFEGFFRPADFPPGS